jgi:hypothetical protein
MSDEIKNTVLKQCNYKCVDCNEKVDNFQIDHKRSLSNGGTDQISNLQVLCIACHKQKSQREQEDGSYIRIKDSESSFNSEVKAIFESPLSHSHAFIEHMSEWKGEKLFHMDINKCRKEILLNSKYNYCQFNVMDKPEIYDGQDGEGLYYVETENYFPLRGNGFYYKPTIDYCLENNIINKENIKYTVQSMLNVPHDYYNGFIDKCYKELPDDLSKLSINSMIGAFKPNTSKHIMTSSICITPYHMEAYHHFLYDDGSFIESFEINSATYYHVFKYQTTMKMETEGPIYE